MKIDYKIPMSNRISIDDIKEYHFVVAITDVDSEYAFSICESDKGFGFIGMRSHCLNEIDFYDTIKECIIAFKKDFKSCNIEVFTTIREVQDWFYNLNFPD
jgi:hypothetical protein